MSRQASTKQITESEFYMWRTLFAMAHVDGTVSDNEVSIMAEALEDIAFSEEQKKTLTYDIRNPQDIVAMFEKISDPKHQALFFKFARDMVWADGDFGKAEQEIMVKLKKVHLKATNVDDLIGSIDLEFDDGLPDRKRPRGVKARDIVFSFREQFFRNR